MRSLREMDNPYQYSPGGVNSEDLHDNSWDED